MFFLEKTHNFGCGLHIVNDTIVSIFCLLCSNDKIKHYQSNIIIITESVPSHPRFEHDKRVVFK